MSEDAGREHAENTKSQHAEHQPAQPSPGFDALPTALEGLSSFGSLLGDPRLNGRGNQPVKVAVMRQAQRTYGNRAVRRSLETARNKGSGNEPSNLQQVGGQFADNTVGSNSIRGLIAPLVQLRPIQRLTIQRQSNTTHQRTNIRVRQVRDLIQARDPSLGELIQNNQFNDQPAPIPITTTINGVHHEWVLRVHIVQGNSRTSLNSRGSSAETRELLPNQPIRTGQQGVRMRHTIIVELDPNFDFATRFGHLQAPDPFIVALQSQFPNPQDRFDFLLAERLFHELVHARIIIENGLSAGSQHTSLFLNYQSALNIASSLTQERSQVLGVLNSLHDLAQIPRSANRDTAIELLLRRFINERYSVQTAGSAFGHNQSNNSVAERYAGVTIRDILQQGSLPRTPDAQNSWNTIASLLRDRVLALYNAIDQRASQSASPVAGGGATVGPSQPAAGSGVTTRPTGTPDAGR